MATGVTIGHVENVEGEMEKNFSDNSEVDLKQELQKDSKKEYPLMAQDVTCNTLSSQLAGTLRFSNKTHDQTISAFPIIVDFRRLIQLSSSSGNGNSIIPGATNQELLHAVVGLYDISLSEMTADVLYASVCDKWAKTILLIQDLKETVNFLEEKKQNPKNTDKETAPSGDGNKESRCEDEPAIDSDPDQEKEDVFEPEESPESLFSEVFSDTESEEEEEDSDEEDFSKGIHAFIKLAAKRRKQRENSSHIESSHVGIENRIIGSVTFEKKYINHTIKVVHLTLLTVRRRFRKYGIGRYIMTQILDPAVVGPYDAVVVHADNGAVSFFERCGFSDDVVLNSRWSELAEQFTNCTLMCYLPGFSGPVLPPAQPTDQCKSLTELDKELKTWKEKSLEAYQAQVTCHMRLRQEILQLHKLAHSQRGFIDELTAQNEQLLSDRMVLGQDLLDSRMERMASKVRGSHHHYSLPDISEPVEEETDDADTNHVLRELERKVEMLDMMRRSRKNNPLVANDSGHSYQVAEEAYVRSQMEPYDHTQDAAEFYTITEEFTNKMAQDKSLKENYEVSMIAKACLCRKAESAFWLCLAGLVDPSYSGRLYYCGSRESPERLQAIIKDGFSHEDFSKSKYGYGIYFSSCPSTAAKFSAKGQLILADVAYGKAEALLHTQPDRKSLSPGYDSAICPGRLCIAPSSTEENSKEEYIIYNPAQAKPLCLISYKTVK